MKSEQNRVSPMEAPVSHISGVVVGIGVGGDQLVVSRSSVNDAAA